LGACFASILSLCFKALWVIPRANAILRLLLEEKLGNFKEKMVHSKRYPFAYRAV